jgi:hypothetical protein
VPVTTDGFPDRPSLFDEEGFWSTPFAAELGTETGCAVFAAAATAASELAFRSFPFTFLFR